MVSVVLPIYNVEKYLDRCVESVVNQTYPNLEILLVDDGSPDCCPEMCEAWARKDPRIKAIHKQNAGLGFARNTGIENASGEYICFIDSDDYIERNTVEMCVSRLTQDRTDLAIYGYQSVAPDGSCSSITAPHCPKSIYRGPEVQEIFLPQLISPMKGNWGILMSSWCCLYSMERIRSSKFRFVSEREIISEDVYSLLKFYKHVRSVSVLSEVFYDYCVNETSLTHTYRKDRYEKIRYFYQESLKLVEELGYNHEVEHAMQGPFLNNTIAALKMIAKSKESYPEKCKALRAIVEDNTMQELLRSDELWVENPKKKILYALMRQKSVWGVYLLACLR